MSCGCGCRGKGGCGPQLSVGMPLVVSLGATDASSIGSAVGAPKGINPALYLRAQLNRFTAAGGAPYQFQFATSPLPLTTVLDAEVASRALFVLNMRAGYAQTMAADPATAALLRTYASAWSNPLGYVTANLALVTDVVRLFADSQKLPAAKGVPQYVKIPGLGDVRQETVVIAGAVAALIYFTRRRR